MQYPIKLTYNKYILCNRVIGQILEVQALDKLDIDSVYPLFKKIKDHLKHHPEDR
jgi:hypothetical protein